LNWSYTSNWLYANHLLEAPLDLEAKAGLNECEAPGTVVTAKTPKRLAQLLSLSHALDSTLQKYRSKTSKLMRFGSLPFRDNFGWLCTVVRVCLICSNKKLCHKKDIFAAVTLHNNVFCHRLYDHLHCKNRPFTYVLRKNMSTLRAGFKPIWPISSNRAPRQQRQSYGLKFFLFSKRSILCHNLKRALFCFDHCVVVLFLARWMLWQWPEISRNSGMEVSRYPWQRRMDLCF